ncbi:MAG: 3-deoxy-manno-octulosonate cytidylyltransferase [Pseudomonadota bacterium]
MAGAAAEEPVTIVIPARHASSRFPGKPLVALKGATGVEKSLVCRAWEAARAVAGGPRVIVATDDARIAEASEAFGAEVAMTSPECRNGTERCAEVAGALELTGIVVNLQGDAPLTPPWFVEALVGAMRDDPACGVATPVLRCDEDALANFRADRAAGRVGGTLAVTDRAGRALYFSKEVIPFGAGGAVPAFHHVGVYAFRVPALLGYRGLEPGVLELAEGLEQLRFLEHGQPITCVEVEGRGAAFWEVNNPADVPRVEAALRTRGIE